jgi:diphosphoinositol-polyphosphate diphosphatase
MRPATRVAGDHRRPATADPSSPSNTSYDSSPPLAHHLAFFSSHFAKMEKACEEPILVADAVEVAWEDVPYYRMRAGCLCVRPADRTILVISSSRHPDRWTLPAGGIERGEVALQAGVRETEEEAGVKGLADVRMVGVSVSTRSRAKTYWFRLDVTEELEVWKESRYRRREWVSFDEAERRLLPHRTADAFVIRALAHRIPVVEKAVAPSAAGGGGAE